MDEPLHRRYDTWKLSDLLCRYPGLDIIPSREGNLVLSGDLAFHASADGHEPLSDVYAVKIVVPDQFPRSLPIVDELNGRIPDDFHKLRDGSLCLGSDLQLHIELRKNPSLVCFVERCLIPYLYGYTYFERYGHLPFGELLHGGEGLLQDYQELFRVNHSGACIQMLELLSMKKCLANKRQCPCGSGQRVGRCHNRILNPLRDLLGRRWWREEYGRWRSSD